MKPRLERETHAEHAVMAAQPVVEAAPVAELTAEVSTGDLTNAVDEAVHAMAGAIPDSKEEQDSMATNTEATIEASADRARAVFGDMNERAKTAVEKGTKVVEELVEFAKGNVEAVVASGRAAAKGTEALVQEASDYGRKSFESASHAARSYATAKSPTELLQLNSELSRSMFDGMMAEASKMSEAYVKVVSDIFAPISSRVSLAAEKFKTAAY